MSNDDALAAQVAAAGERTGEIVWRLPLHAEYDELIKGAYGDLDNAPEARKAGTIVGATFLRTSSARRRGRTSTSPAPRGISAAPTRGKAPPATACACSSSSRARSLLAHRAAPARAKTLSAARSRRPVGAGMLSQPHGSHAARAVRCDARCPPASPSISTSSTAPPAARAALA